MKKLLLTALLLVSASAAEAACPAGSTCQIYNGQYNYTITGGTTARQDAARWPDNGISMKDIGVDCSGLTDSSTALQAAVNAMTGNQALIAPQGCQILLGTGITFTAMAGPQLLSAARIENNANATGQPTFIWNGTGGTMFAYSSVDHPTIRGFLFRIATGKTINKFLSFDGAGSGGFISTDGRVEQNAFDSSNQNNSSFNAIEVSLTSGSNNENWLVQDNDFTCSGSAAALRATNASITSGSPNITASATFVAGDVGKRIRVSYSTGILDTTVLSVTDSTHAVMSANAASTQTNATVHIGEALGVGFHNGPSVNAKHQKLYRNRFANCAIAVKFDAGSFDINFLEGASNDVAVSFSTGSESSSIGNYEDEHDVRFMVLNTAIPVTVWNARYVLDTAEADGFILVTSGINLTIASGAVQNTLQSNAVFFRFTGGATTNVTAIGNEWTNNTYAQVGYSAASILTVLNDTSVDNNFFGTTRFIGLPTVCTGLATGTIRSNSGVMTICP